MRAAVQRWCDRFGFLADEACLRDRDACMAEYVLEFTSAMDTMSDCHEGLTSLWGQLGPDGNSHEAGPEWNRSYDDALRGQQTAWEAASDAAVEIWRVWGAWFSSNVGTLGRWSQEVLRWRFAAAWKHGCQCGHCREQAVSFALKAREEWDRYQKHVSAVLAPA